MQAILLAGGLGTRLKEAVRDVPKPMAPIGEKPFLEYLIRSLKRGGVEDIILAIGYMGELIEDYFKDGSAYNVNISYSYERELLGTAGAIKNAENLINQERFFVLNADTYYQMDYGKLMGLAVTYDFDMALVLRKVPDTSRYGKVVLEGNRLTHFNEKQESSAEGTINGGIYAMKRSVLDMIPNRKCSLENEIIPSMLAGGYALGGMVNDGYFIDIGVPEDYYRFIHDIEKGVIL